MNKQRLTASAMRLECCAATISIPTNHDTETWALCQMERQNYLLQTRSQFVLSTMSSWGGGWVGGTQIHPDPGKRLSNTLTSEVSALLYILLQVLYRLSTQDSRATWLTTGKHLWIAITKQSNPPISLFCKTAQSEKWVNNMAWYHVENHIWVQKNRLTETSSFSTDCKISDQSPQTSYFSFLREN